MSLRGWMARAAAAGLVPAAGAVWAGKHAERVVSAAPAFLSTTTRAPVVPPPVEETGAAARSPAPARADDTFVGVVLAPEATEVAARLDGRLDAMHVRLGDHVAAGELIASMDKRALDRELATLRAGAEALIAEAARSNLLRAQAGALLDRRQSASDAVSGEELASARFGYESAGLTLKVAEARVSERSGQIAQLEQRLSDTEVRAPFEGIVSTRYVDCGATVSRGTPIVRLVGVGLPRVRFALPEGVTDIAPGTAVTVAIAGAEDAFQSLDAEVEKVAPEVDGASRMTYVEARFTGGIPEGLDGRTAGRVAGVKRTAAARGL